MTDACRSLAAQMLDAAFPKRPRVSASRNRARPRRTMLVYGMPLRRLRSITTLVALLLFPWAISRAQESGKHMLFLARGPNGATVYLLGSVHLLSAEAGALPAVVDSAFARAKAVAFEASIDTLEMRAPELVEH